jgi:hypothetical protein
MSQQQHQRSRPRRYDEIRAWGARSSRSAAKPVDSAGSASTPPGSEATGARQSCVARRVRPSTQLSLDMNTRRIATTRFDGAVAVPSSGVESACVGPRPGRIYLRGSSVRADDCAEAGACAGLAVTFAVASGSSSRALDGCAGVISAMSHLPSLRAAWRIGRHHDRGRHAPGCRQSTDHG